MNKKATLAWTISLIAIGLVAAVDICHEQLDGVLLAHPADCAKFVVCRHGETDEIMTCPLGLHFNRFASICDIKERALCEETYIKLIANEVTDCSATSSIPGNPTTSMQAGPSGTTCANSGKCAGKSDGTLIADPNSSGYIVCQCECEIAMPCAPGTAFNETLQTCDHIPCSGSECGGGNGGPSTGPSGTTCSNSGKCSGKPDGTMFADSNSNGYIVCQCECEIAMPCAPGTAFNETLQTCDHIPCSGNNCGGSGGESCGTTCSDSGLCVGKPNGTLIADPNSNGYIKCQCECEIKMSCAPGTAFNETLQTCDHIPCSGSNCGGGGPSTGPSGITCANSGKCAGKSDGTLIADPNSSGYIVCQCECEIAMPCAPGTAFNETLQTCDHIPCSGSNCGGSGGESCGTTCSDSGLCAGKPNGILIADPNSNGYIKCQCECEIKMSCDSGTSFNETSQTCEKIPCSGSNCGGSGGESCGTTCSDSGLCAGKPNGTLIADPNSNGYIKCQCECEIKMSCDSGTSFNETSQTCEKIPCSGSNCGGSGGESCGTTCSDSGLCAGKPNGTLIADPNSNGYIKCQCECEIKMSCDSGTSFNETSQTCEKIPCSGSNCGGSGGESCGTTCSDSGLCAGKPNGTLIADPNSNGYIKCQCECEIKMSCDSGTSFNETSQTCEKIPCSGSNCGGSGGESCGTTCSDSGLCAGKPNGTLIADPNSNGYIKCQCECEIKMSCDSGTSFNETSQTCEKIPCSGSNCGGSGGESCGTTCSDSGLCAGKPNGTLIADPNSNGYIKCQCECEIKMACAPGTAFNETLQTCDHIPCSGSNCGGGGPSTGPSGITCANSGKCAGKSDGTLIADPNSSGYIVCQCECEIAMPCAPGTAFNETLQTCDHIPCSGSNCGGSGGESCGTTCSDSGLCAGKPNGTLIADPNSNGYIKCQCECEIKMSCDSGTSFNETSQTCEKIPCSGSNCGGSGGESCGTTCSDSGLCAGKPNGTLIADPNSNGYIKCQCECEIKMSCDSGTSFNETSQTCEKIPCSGSNCGGSGGESCGTTCSDSGLCAGKPNGTLIADPNSNGYIKCQCECEIKMSCAPGTAFNETLQTCDHIPCSGSNCGGGGPSTGPSGITCANSGKCAGKSDGTLIADPNSSGYIVCQCECEIAMPCAPGTAFNETLQTCDHIPCSGSNCGGSGGESCGTTCSDSGLCAGKPNGTLIADPNSNGYIKCQCECEIKMSCDSGTSFNETSQTCEKIPCSGSNCGGSGGESCGTTCSDSGLCAGKPNGTLIADPNSNGYIKCQCECEIKMSCDSGTSFNETSQTCEKIPCSGSECGGGNGGPSTGPSGTTCSNSGKCSGKPDGTMFADSNSNGYIVCQCECEIAMPCAPGTAFNETLQTCDHIPCSGSECGGGNGGPSTGPSGTTCSNSGKCSGKPDGTMFADSNSNGYIVCQCECEIAMSCSPGTAFNETLQTCDHIPCSGSECGGGNGGPSTGPSGTTCSNSGKCSGKPDGTLFADSKSNGYIVCQCECEIAMPCAPGTAFNEALQTCGHIVLI